jgi:hypothetical protein
MLANCRVAFCQDLDSRFGVFNRLFYLINDLALGVGEIFETFQMLFCFLVLVFQLSEPAFSPFPEAALDCLAAVADKPEDFPLRIDQLFDQRDDHWVRRSIEGKVAFEESGIAFFVF